MSFQTHFDARRNKKGHRYIVPSSGSPEPHAEHFSSAPFA
jgi:hypothetical protein